MGIIPGPSVTPQYYGGDVGGKIADALSMYYQLNRQKQLDALQYGIGLKWPGANDTASAPSGPSIGVGDRIRAALSHVGIGSNPIPAEQAQWKVNQGGPSVGITPNAAQGGTIVAPAPEAGPSHDATSSLGGLPDYMTLPNGQQIPTIMTPFGSRILAAMKTRADIALSQSEQEKNTAEARHTTHIDQSPVFGEAGYNAAKGAEAGAVAQAQLPFDLQKLVMSGQISLRNALAEVQARGGVEAGLQANQQRFTAGQNALGRQQQTTLQQNQQQFERGMLPQRTAADVAAGQQKSIFNTSQGIVGRIGQSIGLLPTKPTTPLPSATGTGATAPGQPTGGLFDDLVPPAKTQQP